MLRVTLKGLLARKVRLLLSAIAVVLGVAMVSGTYVLTDTIGSAFTNLFNSVNRNTAVAVRGNIGAGFSNTAAGADRATLPESLLAKVRAVPGVHDAEPDVSGSAQIFNPKNRKAVANGGAPTLGVVYTKSPLSTLTLRAGRPAANSTEVVVDRGTFNKIHLRLGQTVSIQPGTLPAEPFTIVGVVSLGDIDNLGGATLVGFDLPTAQRLLLKPGQLSQITVGADSGVSQVELAKRIKAVVGKSADVVTGADLSEQTSNGIKDGLGFFNVILQVFGYIALVVGLFIIANTFSMLVGQRARELALLRAVGASRAQVIRSVLAEGIAVGVVGSVAGLGAGIGIAIGIKSLFRAAGIDIPSTGVVVQARTVIVALALGIIVTAIAALFPAIRASRVPPVAAMSETFTLPTRSLRVRGAIGLLFFLAGMGVLLKGTSGRGGKASEVVGIGALLVLISVVILAPVVARPVVGVLAAPVRRLFGAIGILSSENASRNPRRTAATASALMIGLALITAVGVLAASVKTSVGSIVSKGTGATYILLGSGQQSLPPSLTSDLTGKPGIAEASGIAIVPLRVAGSKAVVTATEPAALKDNITLSREAGDLNGLTPSTMLISKKVSDDKGWKVGTSLPVAFSEGGRTTLTVAGIYQENQLAGGYLIDRRTAARYVINLVDVVVLVHATPQASVGQVRTTIQGLLDRYPGIKVQSRGEYIQNAQNKIGQLVNLIYVLLGLSVLIGFFGIINTLALSVIERTREIGLLRAVGMSRRQLRRMVRLEALVIALFGAVLGVAVGSLFGWAILPPLADQGLSEFSYPFASIIVFFVVAGIAGVLAAAFPARRAAKLDVLRAISST
jgi:putative ABC transport system permease protein